MGCGADGIRTPQFLSVDDLTDGDVLSFAVREYLAQVIGYVEAYGDAIGCFFHDLVDGQCVKMYCHII
jgi:hypothetical protein